MVLQNREKNHGFNLHSQGMQVTSFSWFQKNHGFTKPWFFKVIGRKYHEFSENHGFEKPLFFES
jgi:hypothetical protein